MTEELPLVVRWNTFPLDIADPLERFKLSKWNFFLRDKEAQILMGFWEAEDGTEIVGEIVGGGTSDEVIVVLEGQLYVSAPGIPEQVAGPGDLVTAMHYRQTRIVAKERARAFFIVYRCDTEEMEEAFLRKGR